MVGDPRPAMQREGHGDPMSSETGRLRRFYDNAASGYDQWMQFYDRVILGDGRRRVCSRARGATLELAIGTGRNLAFYPQDVHLKGIDLSPSMLDIAGRRAEASGRHVDLRQGDAQALEFPDESFDTVVSTLFFGSVPDATRAAAEAWRVLRPDGQLLLLENAPSPIAPVRWTERMIEPFLVSITGDRIMREPLDFLGPAGFTVVRCDRRRWGFVEEVVASKG